MRFNDLSLVFQKQLIAAAELPIALNVVSPSKGSADSYINGNNGLRKKDFTVICAFS